MLFQTNVDHASEFLQKILDTYDNARAPPIQRRDALSVDHLTVHEFDKCLCKAHSRRGFIELIEQSPDEMVHALELYRHAWVNDVHCVDNAPSPEQGTDYRKAHSLSHLLTLLALFHENMHSDRVEPDSNLGMEIQSFVLHFNELGAFFTLP